MIEDRQRGLNGIGAALMHHSKHERMRPTEDINVRCSTGDMQELVMYATRRINVAACAWKNGMAPAK
jgi:hypothetical protein